MNDLTFHEKSAWGTLLVSLVVGSLYFSRVLGLWQSDGLDAPAMLQLALGYTIFLVVVLVVYHALCARSSQDPVKDERDRLITWRAGAIGGSVLGFGVIGIVVQVVLEGLFVGINGGRAPAVSESPVLIANLLLLVVLLASVVELAARLYLYRRGP
ncbi:MAG: hypothetical protein RQ729_02665 [Wenzhouxiangellaceae bacterium]|nr:hypothetical protein [Wenzhouxiangellaceae bacterium]